LQGYVGNRELSLTRAERARDLAMPQATATIVAACLAAGNSNA
jgi:hypothetical protein